MQLQLHRPRTRIAPLSGAIFLAGVLASASTFAASTAAAEPLSRSVRPAALLTSAASGEGSETSSESSQPSTSGEPSESGASDTPVSEGNSTGETLPESGKKTRGKKSELVSSSEAGEPTSGASGESTPTTPAGESESSPRAPRVRRVRASRVGGCTLSIETTTPTVPAGESVTFTGKLLCPQSVDVAEQPITVFQREHTRGVSGFSLLASGSGEADGSYSITVADVQANSIFYASSPLARSKRIVIKVTPVVTIKGPAGLALSTRGDHLGGGRHNRFTFTGNAGTIAAGARLELQDEYAASGEQWHTIAFARVGEEGGFAVAHSFKTAGEVSVRVLVRPKGPYVAGVSESLTYEVAQAQNPKLTIQSSAEPVAAGASVTITGIAAGEAEGPVALLARTPGHPFTALAKATTDSTGNYSFTVTPPQNTTYVVTTASETSAELFEGVRYTLTTAPAPQSIQAGTQMSFSGTIVGAHEGQVVYLQRQSASGVGFRVVGEGKVGAESTYSIPAAFSGAATAVLRIKVPGDAESVGTTSQPFTLGLSSAPESPTS
jgi:hypothetical protein